MSAVEPPPPDMADAGNSSFTINGSVSSGLDMAQPGGDWFACGGRGGPGGMGGPGGAGDFGGGMGPAVCRVWAAILTRSAAPTLALVAVVAAVVVAAPAALAAWVVPAAVVVVAVAAVARWE